MNVLEKNIMEEREKAEKMLTQIYKEVNMLEPDNGVIKVIGSRSYLQLYIKENTEDGKYGRYLPMSEIERAKNIIRTEYLKKLKDALEKRIKALDYMTKKLEETDPVIVYQKMGKGKKRLVEPIEISDEEYIRQWENCEYEGKEFYNDAIEIYTERGERVRSKSEKIIADKLYKENIPYRYEYPLKLLNGTIVFPDFTILDEIRRRNIIFEHFGMMDNEEYANNAISKLQMYAKEGYVLGDNLFVTMETSERPLDSRVLDGIVGVIKGEWL